MDYMEARLECLKLAVESDPIADAAKIVETAETFALFIGVGKKIITTTIPLTGTSANAT